MPYTDPTVQKQAQADHYQNNKAIYHERHAARRRMLRARVNEYKRAHPCKCKEGDPVCLQFHHADNNKEHGVSELVARVTKWETIEREMKKCTVMCANCHLKEHERLRVEAENQKRISPAGVGG